MKKIILILCLIFLIQINTKAQKEKQFTTATNFTTLKCTALREENNFSKNSFSSGNNGPEKDYDYYMKKSKNQRTTGWILLGGGVLLSGIGVLTGTHSFDNAEAGIILLGAGALSGIISIPLMIMASVNKHKAKVMLANQKTGFGVPSNVSKDITGVTMIIPIGK